MKRLIKGAAVAVGLAGLGVVLERLIMAAPPYEGPLSDHFDGRRFYNRDPGWQSERSFLKWQATRRPQPWRRWTEAPAGPPPPQSVDDGRLRITFINHSTTLIQLDGMNILTDPIWSDRCSPVTFAGPRRHRPPGIQLADLPRIDAVVVSHNHYDHLDIDTLTTLIRRHHPRVITPLGNGQLMARYGLSDAVELDWWQSTALNERMQVTVVPAQHFSARGLSDRNVGLWGGFVISGPAGNVYFAGDTGWGGHFAEIGRRFDPLRLALIPIGAYLPRWFMRPAHIDPVEAVAAHRALRAQTSVAIHFGTFRLGDDGEVQPVEDLMQAIADGGDPRFWVLGFGEGRDVP